MLEAVIAILLLFAFASSFCLGLRWGVVENYLLKKDIQRLESGIARERALRVTAEKRCGNV